MGEDFPEFIIKHRQSKDGEILYFVKWVGCDILDNTWETETKLLSEWPFVVNQYKTNLLNNTLNLSKPSPVSEDYVYRYTNSVQDWETDVESITYVEKSKLPGLVVYIKWKNGLKSVHHSSEVYHKCPQKMLDYFEQFRRFKPIEF